MVLIDYMKANQLLKKYRIRSIESKYVKDAEDAVDFSRKGRIVMKVISQKAMHKSRSGLIALDLDTEKEVSAAYKMLTKKAAAFRPYKILAQRMVSGGVEMIIGGSTDPQFGKVLLVGLGGIYVEAFHDVAMGLCPVNRHEAEAMLHQLKAFGAIVKDLKTENEIANLLVKVSRMFSESRIIELDLNPVIIHDGTYEAVDLRLIK